MPRKFTSATVGLGRPSCGGRRTRRCLQRDCVLRQPGAVRPSAAIETSVPHGRNASNPFVPTSARSSQVGSVRFPLKPMTVQRIIICITGSSRGINATGVRGPPAPRPCGVPQRLSRGSGQAPAIARAARRWAGWLPQEIPLSSTMRPNPSIEGTSTSGLRPLAAAHHVKR